uniref:UPAR/Ly6 domain-containing protein n=1 Tax=Sciurus vulgaris TaxID=55149 RepID=A0A8D2CT44_SCIVU
PTPLPSRSLYFFISSTVSWEIKMSDFEEKDVDAFASNGFRCPTCFAVKGRQCKTEFKWCAGDRTKCVEFSGVIDTGFTNLAIELKKCARADQCSEPITSYMGFPVSNESRYCKSAFGGGARARPATSILFVLFLGKLLH